MSQPSENERPPKTYEEVLSEFSDGKDVRTRKFGVLLYGDSNRDYDPQTSVGPSQPGPGSPNWIAEHGELSSKHGGIIAFIERIGKGHK